MALFSIQDVVFVNPILKELKGGELDRSPSLYSNAIKKVITLLTIPF